MNGQKRFLFICGCPRSGTTALWNLLTSSPVVVLGVERYGSRVASRWNWLSPALFEYDRFFQVEAGDTFYDDLEAFSPYYRTARTHWHQATFVGDKLPRLYARFRDLERVFPRARVLFIFRNIFDVAASYKKRAEDQSDTNWRRDSGVHAAIEDWSRSIEAFQSAGRKLDVLPVVYEELFMHGRGLDILCDFLGISERSGLAQYHRNLMARSEILERERTRNLTALESHEICMRAPILEYRRIVEGIQQRA